MGDVISILNTTHKIPRWESLHPPRVTFAAEFVSATNIPENTTSLTELTRNWSIDQPTTSSFTLAPTPEGGSQTTCETSRDRKRARSNGRAESDSDTPSAPSTSSAQSLLATNAVAGSTLPKRPATRAEQQADRATLDNFRVSPHIEKIWRQARSYFIAVDKSICRSTRFSQWAHQGLIPQWAIGTGPIPPHLLGDQKEQHNLGSLLEDKGISLLFFLSKSLKQQAHVQEAQAKALLHTVQNLYGEDQTSFKLAKQKIISFCTKERSVVNTQLDRQEGLLKSHKSSP